MSVAFTEKTRPREPRFVILETRAGGGTRAYRPLRVNKSGARGFSHAMKSKVRARAELRSLAAGLEAALVGQGTLELLAFAAPSAIAQRRVALSLPAAFALARLAWATGLGPREALHTVVQLSLVCQLNPFMAGPLAALLAMTALAGPGAKATTARDADAPPAAQAAPGETLRSAASSAWATWGSGTGGHAESARPGAAPRREGPSAASVDDTRRTQHRPFARANFRGPSGFARASFTHAKSGASTSGASGRQTHHTGGNASGGRQSRAEAAGGGLSHVSRSETPLAWAYARLGLEPGAPYEAVLRAYRRQAMALHPDRKGGNEAAFKAMKAGFEALKAQYEADGNAIRAPSGTARAKARSGGTGASTGPSARSRRAAQEPASASKAANLANNAILALPAPTAQASAAGGG